LQIARRSFFPLFCSFLFLLLLRLVSCVHATAKSLGSNSILDFFFLEKSYKEAYLAVVKGSSLIFFWNNLDISCYSTWFKHNLEMYKNLVPLSQKWEWDTTYKTNFTVSPYILIHWILYTN
jgi:hypothetical protein